MTVNKTCVILDDEPKAVSVLSSIIENIDELELLATFTNPYDALVQMPHLNPDVLFCDIDMPGKNGFEVVDEIRIMTLNPVVVFTTGYDQFAVKAIKKQAYDYLLKPITKTDILSFLARFNALTSNKKTGPSVGDGKLKFNTLNGFYVIEVSKIAFVKADGNYSELHLMGGDYKLVTSNLARVESLLIEKNFRRIGRSLIINIDFLTQVDRKHCQCILDTGKDTIKLPINRKRIKDLGELFS